MAVQLKGGCHCGQVRFTAAVSSREVDVYACNCSVCAMKRNDHFVVPEDSFELLSGKDALTLYQFGSKTAKHFFCKHCGVQSFYTPRSNPKGVAVTWVCIDKEDAAGIIVTCKTFDGQNWEANIGSSDITSKA
ncbi:Mss4-like protein [Baffinella frigidus]|nr:Mss4-like protein [Cryptophyta sp. CCMP2293]